jgi:sugar-phosphatase
MTEIELSAQALLFDSDGVLVDSLSRVDDVWTAWARSFDLDPAPILPVLHGRPAAETIAEAAPHIDHQLAVTRLEQMEIDAVPGTRALPGATRLTRHLAPGVWAVVTSASRRLADVRLAAAGIVPPVLVTSDDVTNGKPHPEPYAIAAAHLGAQPENCIVFEDAPAGVAAARAAGATVVGVMTSHDAATLGADHHVASLADVRVEPHDGDASLRVYLSR